MLDLITKAMDSCFEIWDRDCSFMFLMFFLGEETSSFFSRQNVENLGIRKSQLPNWVARWIFEPWSDTEISMKDIYQIMIFWQRTFSFSPETVTVCSTTTFSPFSPRGILFTTANSD